jgi:hypothetical protein
MIAFKLKEAETYKKELKEAFPDQYPSKMGSMPVGKEYHNPSAEEETGKRKAFKGIAWIKYWQYLSGNNSNHLKCTFCGEDIYVDVNGIDCHLQRSLNDEERNYRTKEDYQAVGGHLHLNGKDKKNGYMIVPMCKTCNAKSSNETLTVIENNMFVEEIGAAAEKDN